MRLVFGGAADLDLYVTGPSQETVYFANTPAAGGALDADRRCGAPTPRVETVTFPQARPGRYRVGVDFPARCRRGRGSVRFLVRVETGGRRHERPGEIELGHFRPVVLEIDFPGLY